MKFGQIIKYNVKNIFFFKNDAEIKADRLVPYLYLFCKKASYETKASGLRLSLNIFW